MACNLTDNASINNTGQKIQVGDKFFMKGCCTHFNFLFKLDGIVSGMRINHVKSMQLNAANYEGS